MSKQEISITGLVVDYNGKEIEINDHNKLSVGEDNSQNRDNIKNVEENIKKEKVVDADPTKDDTLF